MACVSKYTTISAAPVISGDASAFEGLAEGWIIGVQTAWESNLRKITTLSGNKMVPDIVKGSVVISVLVPPTGYSSTGVLSSMSNTASCVLCIDGKNYTDTYYTGGQLGIQDLGEGMKTLRIGKRFTIFGICPTASA